MDEGVEDWGLLQSLGLAVRDALQNKPIGIGFVMLVFVPSFWVALDPLLCLFSLVGPFLPAEVGLLLFAAERAHHYVELINS